MVSLILKISKNCLHSLFFKAANPKIIISDEAMQPLTEHRGSTSSSITLQTTLPMATISNSITYGAKLNRFVNCYIYASKKQLKRKIFKGVLEVEQ